MPEPDAAAFATLLDALDPYLSHVVIAGGWAHRLYRLHPLATPPDYPPLATLDADVALKRGDLPAEADIRKRLVDRKFEAEFVADHTPPVTEYRLGKEDTAFYAEFLTPLAGAEVKSGKSDMTAKIAGVNALKLRYLEILLGAPWAVTVRKASGIPVPSAVAVRVPNPVSYIVQKLLVQHKRKAEDRGKDLLYVHDTLDLFGGSIDELRKVWVSDVKSSLHKNQVKALDTVIATSFVAVTDDGRRAVLEARAAGRELTAERIVETCRFGLMKIMKG